LNTTQSPAVSAATSSFPASRFSRPTWAEINLAALKSNAQFLSSARGGSTPLIAVIKANAYGHGAVEVARALLELPQVQLLAVASVDEARVLREAGIRFPILLLSAILPQEAEAAVALDLQPTLSTPEVAVALDEAARLQNKIARAHFKIDSGMGRLGFSPFVAAQFWRALPEYSHLQIAGVFTHFANADASDDEMTPRQLEVFQSVLNECAIAPQEYFVHAANSAASLRYPQAEYSAVRPGIALYGASPFGSETVQNELRPVMSLKARVTEIRNIQRGQSVSYGATWRAARDSQIALVPIGYADGYPRNLSNTGEVLVQGQRCKVAGRVTMDQILVDVTDVAPRVKMGDVVTAWGLDESGGVLRVEEVAERAGTISYELLCRVASRVPRVYLNAK
jgi:alanine racemase